MQTWGKCRASAPSVLVIGGLVMLATHRHHNVVGVEGVARSGGAWEGLQRGSLSKRVGSPTPVLTYLLTVREAQAVSKVSVK